MTRDTFACWCKEKIRILDGATGSCLLRAGMPRGVCTEAWVLEHPQPLLQLQREYARAGSEIVYAPTFGANSASLTMHGFAARVEELNRELPRLTRQAVGKDVLVAGDMTTTGQPVEPYGTQSYDELLEIYRHQATALLAGGVDLFAVETMMGVTESLAAVEAIRSVSDLPVLCTLSVQSDGKCYFDGTIFEAAELLQSLGVDAFGINCASGPDLMESLVASLHQAVTLPIIAKPNAGLPEILPTGEAVYKMDAATFAGHMRRLMQAGVSLVGGCCGTTPAHIRALTDAVHTL